MVRKIYFKFPLLNNKQWLEERYLKEQLSCSEIAKLIGCTKDAVRVALIRNNISLRESKETNKILLEKNGAKSRIYPLLNNKEWLEQKYLLEKLSLNKIVELVGAKDSNSVRQALLR